MISHRPGEHARRGDAGFTLVELMLAIVISAIITGAIGNAIIVGLKTTDKTESRLGQSHDTQLVANWLQVDVASAAPSGISITTGDASGCSGTSPGTNLAALPYAAGPGDDARRSAYRLEPGSGSTKKIVRYHCLAGGTPEKIVVATEVSSATAALSAAAGQVTVTFTVNEPPTDTFQATMFKVSGHNRTGTPDTTPQSTAPTPTTAPPAPCVIDAFAVSPNPVTMAAGTNLATDVNVLVSVSGDCASPLTMSFPPGSTSTDVTFDGSGAATLGKSAYPWAPGPKPVTIKQGPAPGTPVDTTPRSFTVNPMPQPCTVSAAPTPLSPPSTGRSSNEKLLSDVVVTVASSGSCTGLGIAYSPNSEAMTQTMTQSGSTWTVTIPGPSGDKWNPGPHPISVTGATNSLVYTLGVT